MLNKPECKVEFDQDGKAYGVTSEGETAKCKNVVCDPSYLPDKVKKVGKVARAVCIMSHPIPNTNDADSLLIILPQEQLGRKSDMYVFCCSYSHKIAPEGKYIALVSTEAETDQPEIELKPGIDLLGPLDETFFGIYDRYEPVNDSEKDNCFISTFMMASGALVRVLIHTSVTEYLNFRVVEGSFIYHYGRIIKMPATEVEAVNNHPYFLQRHRIVPLYNYVKHYDENDLESHQGRDLNKVTTRELFAYVFCCSYSHKMAPEGKYIAFVSTEAETDQPEIELKPGIDLFGRLDETFFDIYDRYEPVNDSEKDNCFITTSYDATTHFESTVQDVLSMYRKITGKELDLSVDLRAASAAGEE